MTELSGVQDSGAAVIGNASRSVRAPIALWVLGVLVAWSGAHALNRWVLLMDESAPAARFAWWTTAKLCTWLLPTLILLRRAGHASARWLGLTSTQGFGIALLWTALWIAVQVGGVRLHLPLFSLPPADLDVYTLLGALVVAPLFEELMFRGAMLRTLKEAGYPRGVSVVVCAIAFALLHVPGWIFRHGLNGSIAGSFAAACGFGVVAGFLAWRIPSLWGPIFLHWTNNFWSTGALAWCVEKLLHHS